MTFSKQLFPLFFFFLFPLRYASTPKKCSSFFNPLKCGPLEVPIRFPLCDHAGFNLHCDNRNKTVLELPMSGSFLVRDIDYRKQQIYIKDPENCLIKRLLTFNMSGSSFSSRFNISYTFFTCPNKVVLPYWYRSVPVPCLSNSTSTFFATTNADLLDSMLPSCQIVKRLHLPASWPEFSSYLNNGSLMLEWDLPNCKGCAMSYLRCGFKNTASLEIKCFSDKDTGHVRNGKLVLIITDCIMGTAFVFSIFISIRNYKYDQRLVSPNTIDSYKKVELGGSRKLIVCPICLSDYASKETIRFILECNHWLPCRMY